MVDSLPFVSSQTMSLKLIDSRSFLKSRIWNSTHSCCSIDQLDGNPACEPSFSSSESSSSVSHFMAASQSSFHSSQRHEWFRTVVCATTASSGPFIMSYWCLIVSTQFIDTGCVTLASAHSVRCLSHRHKKGLVSSSVMMFFDVTQFTSTHSNSCWSFKSCRWGSSVFSHNQALALNALNRACELIKSLMSSLISTILELISLLIQKTHNASHPLTARHVLHDSTWHTTSFPSLTMNDSMGTGIRLVFIS